MSKHCYYCGAEGASCPLQISPTFTAAGMIKNAHSDVMCDRCYGIMFGDIQRVWYHNKDDDRWVKLYLRGIHQIWKEGTLISPRLLPPEEHIQISATGNVGKPERHPVLSQVPKRTEVRDWLINPPEPPFTIAIAESGQKHILFLAQTGYDRENFPVQFEMDSLSINRTSFIEILNVYESLLNLNFSKTEIDSGEYRPDRIMTNFESWQLLEQKIVRHRSSGKPSRMLQLISFVATKPDFVQEIKKDNSKPKKTEEKKEEMNRSGQLLLF